MEVLYREETTQTIKVPSRLAVNLGEAAVASAAAGAGIDYVLSYLIDDLVKSGSLVKLLGAYESPPTPVSLYPSLTVDHTCGSITTTARDFAGRRVR